MLDVDMMLRSIAGMEPCAALNIALDTIRLLEQESRSLEAALIAHGAQHKRTENLMVIDNENLKAENKRLRTQLSAIQKALNDGGLQNE